MAVATESTKPNKVLDVYVCCVLHNMYLRHQKRAYVMVDPAYDAERVEFAKLVAVVLKEIEEAEDAAGAVRVVVPSPARSVADSALKTAGLVMRDQVCAALWGRRVADHQ